MGKTRGKEETATVSICYHQKWEKHKKRRRKNHENLCMLPFSSEYFIFPYPVCVCVCVCVRRVKYVKLYFYLLLFTYAKLGLSFGGMNMNLGLKIEKVQFEVHVN
jgi:hypothetical protein